MNDTLVSINCITYNHENYIKDAIDSFIMQKVNFKYEILIGEDCSTDNTLEIVKQYQEKYPNIIRVITGEKNVGAIQNLKRLQSESKGKYIAICEGDDYWIDPYKLQKQVEYMENNPECSICFHPEKVMKVDTNNFNGYIGKHSNKPQKYKLEEIALPGFIPTASRLQRSYIMNNPPYWYDNAIAGDFASAILYGMNGYAYYMPDIMAVYRENVPNSATANLRGVNAIKKKIEWQQSRLITLNEADKWSNFKYSKEIYKIKLYSEIQILILKGDNKSLYNKKYRKSLKKIINDSTFKTKIGLIIFLISPKFNKIIRNILGYFNNKR